MKEIRKRPVLSSIIISFLLGMIWCMVLRFDNDYTDVPLHTILLLSGVFGFCYIYPALLTIINIVSLFWVPGDIFWKRTVRRFDCITLVLGVLYNLILLDMEFVDIVPGADWNVTLYNDELHTPVWTQAQPTFLVLCGIGLAGYLVLSYVRLEKMPPLVIVMMISAMYISVAESIVWCIQIFDGQDSLFMYLVLCLLPFNWIMITVKTLRYKVREWNRMDEHRRDVYADSRLLNRLNDSLQNAGNWPVAAFILMWPLLGIMLCVLALFGQRPDYIVKMWTETADWKLSQQTAPPNLYRDEHYLCTVAAGGHKEIVKPIRMGERHGHRVVVNRQLCIANAFEQILEERTPRFHKHVRYFYDTYGFPVARLIRTKTAADVVYILMKPLEFIFLIVIYLCDAKPENRIAVQYLPRT